MMWKNNEIKTVGNIINAVENIKTKEEANEFKKIYRKENEYADANIGYIFGYLSKEERKRLQELFAVDHPVFGRNY